jgi:hypothetical protein
MSPEDMPPPPPPPPDPPPDWTVRRFWFVSCPLGYQRVRTEGFGRGHIKCTSCNKMCEDFSVLSCECTLCNDCWGKFKETEKCDAPTDADFGSPIPGNKDDPMCPKCKKHTIDIYIYEARSEHMVCSICHEKKKCENINDDNSSFYVMGCCRSSICRACRRKM